jgi:hypothetical protein
MWMFTEICFRIFEDFEIWCFGQWVHIVTKVDLSKIRVVCPAPETNNETHPHHLRVGSQILAYVEMIVDDA